VAEPLDWKTRLAIHVDGNPQPVSAIDSFTPTFTTQVTPIHSIEADNIGAIFHPQTATFTMTLKAIGPHVAELTKFAIEGKKFNICLSENKGTDWTFKQMLFRDCLITSANPSNVVIDGAPTATFNGVILGFTAETDRET
jgi:hypothetical protein